MRSRFSAWLFTRATNFILFSALAFGTPVYLVLALVREEEAGGWYRLGDAFFGFGSGLVWALGMWFFFVKPKLTALRKASMRRDPGGHAGSDQ